MALVKSDIKNNIIQLWIEKSPELINSNDLNNDIYILIKDIINKIGFDIDIDQEIELKNIVKSMVKELNVINISIYNLKKFELVNNKIKPIINILGSIQKRTIELLIKTFINNYLYKIVYIITYKLEKLNVMIAGNIYNKDYSLSKKNYNYIKYELYYLLNKIKYFT